MLIIISPAKSLDFETRFKYPQSTSPIFLKDTEELSKNLQQLSVSDIKNIMQISDNLAKLNYERFQNFDTNPTQPALLAFNGDVYEGIDKKNYNEKDFNFAQNHLRILSGFYGLLKPLDLIKPYRLEMGTDFKKINFFTPNLYKFWGDKITLAINKDPSPFIVNLASKEYFSAINLKKINKPIIEIIFKEKKGEEYKVIGINSKKARGLMTNFIIKNKITDLQKIKNFQLENYSFVPSLSNENQFIFVR